MFTVDRVVHHPVASKESVENVVGVESVLVPPLAVPLRVCVPLSLSGHRLRVFRTKLVVVRPQIRVGQALEGLGDSWRWGRGRGDLEKVSVTARNGAR